MPWSERFVRDHKRQTDRAIHRAGAQLASDPPVLGKFHELVACARNRASRLFEATVLDGRHLGVEALINLSRFRDTHLRSVHDWAGTSSSWRPAVASLAHHLVCEYAVPVFLASAWYAADPAGDRKRHWFVAHSQGASFRSLDLPIAMTRKMEHLFLASQDHLPVELALRRAELLALGATGAFVKAVLTTPLATDLRDDEFWRTVWHFVITHARDLELGQIGPMIDYIQAVRREEGTFETRADATGFNSPQSAFSMKGRTVQSMLRLMQNWHRSLGRSDGATFSWAKSPFQPYMFEEPVRDESEIPRRWQITELTDNGQLRKESAELHHCVASYADRCYRGASSIWSIRLRQGEKVHHVLTIEIDPKRRAVVQARGRANRAASGRSLRLLQDWAARERLRILL